MVDRIGDRCRYARDADFADTLGAEFVDLLVLFVDDDNIDGADIQAVQWWVLRTHPTEPIPYSQTFTLQTWRTELE